MLRTADSFVYTITETVVAMCLQAAAQVRAFVRIRVERLEEAGYSATTLSYNGPLHSSRNWQLTIICLFWPFDWSRLLELGAWMRGGYWKSVIVWSSLNKQEYCVEII